MRNVAKWIWLSEKCGVGSTDMAVVLERFGSVGKVYSADCKAYIANGVNEHLAEKLADKSLENAYSIMQYCEESDIGILTYGDGEYPKSLRSLKDPPAVLYYVGRLPDLNNSLCVAAVGTRKMSEYGMRAAYKIAYEVASSGAIVISGMALGIDSVAASAAIAAKGKTVAVLGCGIDVIYPKEHEKLYKAICENGAVLSEYPPSTEPRGFHFPVRNRLISGLSQGTCVVDASMKSGALITAKNAILQGRDVYAVPSNIDAENASGTNSLIRDGAQAVLSGYDIVKNYIYLFRDTLDMQRLRNSEKHSAFDPSVTDRLGVKARGERSAYGGAADRKTVSADVQRSERSNSKGTVRPKGMSEEAKEPAALKNASGDSSRAALESLSEKHRRIFEEIPLDRAIPTDYLIKTGFKLAEVISALTVLEIKGLITSLPGGLYQRK